jgi:HlyD family secretion protein
VNHRLRIGLAVVVLGALVLLGWLWFGSRSDERYLSGYVEGEPLFLAAPVAGTVTAISAVEGDRVKPGQQLFSIDPATLSAQREQASAQLAQSRSQIAAAEADALQTEAEVASAAAELDRARRDLSRLLAVKRDNPEAVAGKDIDAAQAAQRAASARLSAARKAVEARRAQATAARAQTDQARAREREADIRVGQLAPPAPSAALVEEVFFHPGEWVAANQPVVSLLPDDRIKLRFFVPEAEIARYRPGRSVRFSCDGCAEGLAARISYVSPRSEFTPPVIFSRDSRDRLVFMVEARPANPARLRPGQPVDVVPLGGE